MTVSQILQQLRAEEDRLSNALCDLEQQLKANQRQLKQVQSAMQSLGEKPASKSPKKQSRRQSITRADVASEIQQALERIAPLEEDTLKSTVKDELRKLGKSLNGFELRFREAITGFQATPMGYQLNDRVLQTSDINHSMSHE